MPEEKKKSVFPYLTLVIFALPVLLLMQYKQYSSAVYDQVLLRALNYAAPLKRIIGLESLDIKEENASIGLVSLNQQHETSDMKQILFYGRWFSGNWENRFGPETPEGLKEVGCPIWRCNFTYDVSAITTADAVVVESGNFGRLKSRQFEKPEHQRWVWVNVEAPYPGTPKNTTEADTKWNPSFLINWTMTYHSHTDVVAFYGYFSALEDTQIPIIPNTMSQFPKTMKKFQDDVASGITLDKIKGSDWLKSLNKTKIVAWMSSHCSTGSRREFYIKELTKYIDIDTYGRCGKSKCGPRSIFINDCWTDVLGRYSFYMAMENSICEDYITEKLYLPMLSNIVPVVWGGANYDLYLPPGSYIDARQYHPRDLAALLTKLHNNPKEYAKYHLWRGYWQVHRGGSFCQLCHRLHTDKKEKHYFDIGNFRLYNGKCLNAPRDMFNTKNRPEYWKLFLEKHNSTML